MKLYNPLLLLLLSPVGALASTSVLTNTIITDPDSQTWNNCTWSALVVSPNGAPTISGTLVPIASLTASGSCSSSGQITATLLDTGSIDQTGASWQFTLTPNASFGPTVISTTAVTGATPNLSTVLSAVPAPRYPPGTFSFGYLDKEIQNPIVGSVYFNVTGGCQHQNSLSGWSTCSSGGSGTVSSVSVTAANGVSGTVATATTTPAISLTLGAITPTTVNGLTVTTSTGTLTVANGKTATINNTLTLAGTDSTTMTFPSASATITQTIASGTSALGTSSISSATCATVVTTSATGVAATDSIDWTPNASIKAVTGYVPSTSGGLTISAYPTANNVNFDVCNWSASPITPGAVTLNWVVTGVR